MTRWLFRSILGFSLGLAVLSGARAQDELDRVQFDDWILRCNKAQPPRCDLKQRSVNNEGKQIIDFGIGYNAAEKVFPIVVELPLGILVQQPIRFKIDDAVEFTNIRISHCLPSGCLVQATAPPDMIDAMRSGQRGALIAPLPDGKFVALEISLRGFTAASTELVARNSRN
jgi:invasion protein IalB